MNHAVRAAIAVAASVACVVGCANSRDEPTQTARTETTATTQTTQATAAPQRETYSTTTTLVEGRTADGKGTWQIRIGQVSGADRGVADAFNRASRASADHLLGQFDPYGPPENPWRFTAEPTVTVGAVFIAQLLTGSVYVERAAHPVGYVATVVIDARTARPITLADVFTDEQAALDRLSEQTRKTYVPLTDGGRGSAPTAENFDNWIPTAEGMVIHFDDYQVGPHGLLDLTVPWSELTGLMKPDMVALTEG